MESFNSCQLTIAMEISHFYLLNTINMVDVAIATLVFRSVYMTSHAI